MKPILFSALSLLTLLPLTANASDNQEHVQHEAHVHGEATLHLILQGNDLEMELHSPAMNILGFEHKAASAEEKQKVKDAIATLENASELFSFSGTECHHAKAEAELDQEEHDDHEKHADHNVDHQSEHSEFDVDYAFRCDDGARLSAIVVKLSKRFSGIHKLDAEWIFNENQGAAELTGNAFTIKVE